MYSDSIELLSIYMSDGSTYHLKGYYAEKAAIELDEKLSQEWATFLIMANFSATISVGDIVSVDIHYSGGSAAEKEFDKQLEEFLNGLK